MQSAIIKTWRAVEKWLRAELGDTAWPLRQGVSEAELRAFEKAVGFELPVSVRALWSVCGGEKKRDGLGMGNFVLLSPKDALAEWKDWKWVRDNQGEDGLEALNDPCRSRPRGAIHEEYTRAGWIPLWKERYQSNYIGVDRAWGLHRAHP